MIGIVFCGHTGNLGTYAATQLKKLAYDIHAALVYVIKNSSPIYREFKKKECL